MSDVLMAIAWRDCLRWAVNEPAIVEAFSRETGTVIAHRKSSPLDALIDAATGFDKEIGQRFVEWFNVNVWGDEVPEVVG